MMEIVTLEKANEVLNDMRIKAKESNGTLKVVKSNFRDYNKYSISYRLVDASKYSENLFGEKFYYVSLVEVWVWKYTKWNETSKQHEPIYKYGIEYSQ